MNTMEQFMFNGALMTIVSLVVRTVSVVFNVYVSNSIGAEGLGLFTLISTVYGFALTLATSGVNLATTRLISESVGKHNCFQTYIRKNKEIKFILRKCINYALCFSVPISILIFFLSSVIGHSILNDERTIFSLKLLSFTFVPISISSVINGYFIAVKRVYKNAITQITEQFIKISVTVILFGMPFCNDIEKACVSMVIGIFFSELTSFITNIVLYIKEKEDKSILQLDNIARKKTSKKLLEIALPVAFSAYIRSGLISLEHILIPICLQKSGINKSLALAEYGTVQSMVFPLVLFPSALMYSFASLLVSEISESNAANNKKRINRIISKVIKTSLVYSIGVAGVMLFFATEIGNAFYPDSNAEKYIKMIAPLVPIMYIDSSVDAILKGMGKQVYSMGINILDSFLSVILVIYLLPKYGVMGYIMTVYFTELVNTTLSITKLLNLCTAKLNIIPYVIKSLFSVIIATSTVNLVSTLHIIPIYNSKTMLVIYLFITITFYFFTLLLFGAIKKEHIIRFNDIFKSVLKEKKTNKKHKAV